MDREQARDTVKEMLGDYLSSKGINTRKPFKCLSPDHHDAHPSMSYDRKRQRCKCFSCGVSYDIFDLVGIDYGLSEQGDIFSKAYELYGIEIDSGSVATSQQAPKKPAKEEPQEAPADYMEFYNDAMQHISETDYLKHRGISEDTAKRFMLGYVKEWRHPKAPKAPASPRLIIPTGKSSYLARDTRPELTETEKRYSKSKVGSSRIYNRRALREAAKPIFIVEGEIDALSIIEVGGEAVGLGSTTNYRQLIAILEKQPPAKPLILSLDADKSGQDTTEAIKNELERLQIDYYIINPYNGHKDANEALMSDREAFKTAIREAEAVEEQAQEAEKEEYLKNSAAGYIKEFMDGIKESVNTPAISTGFKSLDRVLDGGLYEGLYICGAISSLGKTTFITQIADQIAADGRDVLIFSLEMARSEIIAKSISRLTYIAAKDQGISQNKAKTARGITAGARYSSYDNTEKGLIDAAIKKYATYAGHIFISEGVGDIGAAQVRETVKRHISIIGKAPVVIIDYVQILAPYEIRATDKQNTDKAVLELKRMSRDFKTPVIGISSFNRANYTMAATMEAFKESGALEYGADCLIGLQLKGAGTQNFNATEEKRKNPREIEAVILKNRNGATGDIVEFTYSPLFNYFEEVETPDGFRPLPKGSVSPFDEAKRNVAIK